MKKFINKRFLTCFLSFIVLFVASFFVTKNINVAYATSNFANVEDYTDSDELLIDKEDNIQLFAGRVKSLPTFTYFPELSQVIPIEYLESTETNATFSYYGKEYGFYMVKEGEQFDLLLIDFIYEFNSPHSDLEYIIKIAPILQQTFTREETEEGYTWKKDYNNYKYYVANPRFLSSVQNENALNYGDEGYSKLTDDGLIIQQSRFNYKGISYATEEDADKIIGKFVADQYFGLACSALDEITFGVGGTALSFIKDTIEFGVDLYEASLEKTYEVGNEVNIQTNFSREGQRNNPDKNGYTKTAAVNPRDEIILSADNSFAEFITQLDGINYKSRLTQICEFDIMRRKGSFDSMEKVTGNGDDKSPLCYNKTVLFKESGVTEFSREKKSQQHLVYLLNNGSQEFTYTSPDFATFCISSLDKLADIKIYEGSEYGKKIDITKINDNSIEFILENDKTYFFKFSQQEKGYYYINFERKAEEIFLGDKPLVHLKGNESKYFKYTCNEDQFLEINFVKGNYNFDIYSGEEFVEYISLSESLEFEAENGQQYLICVKNNSSDIIDVEFSFGYVEEIKVNTSKNVAVNDKKYLRFYAPFSGKYKVVCENISRAYFNTDYDGKAYLLNAGYHYLIIEGNTAIGTCTVEFDSQNIEVSGGQSNTILGDGKSAFLKFEPKATLNYCVLIENDVATLQQYYVDGQVYTVNNSDTVTLYEGQTYYLYVVSSNTKLPTSFKVKISPYNSKTLNISKESGSGNIEFISTGADIVKVIINEDNIYDFNVNNVTLYDSNLVITSRNSVLSNGIYYLEILAEKNTNVSLTVKRTGRNLEVNNVIAITKSGIYKYNLTIGSEYEIRIGGSSNNFTYSVSVYNSYWVKYNLTKSSEVYSFVATDAVVFVELKIENMNGEAAIFTLKDKNVLEESSCEKIAPEIITFLSIGQNGKFVKVDAGNYTLFVHKNIGSIVNLYVLGANTTNEFSGQVVDSETLQQSTALKYNLTLTVATEFIICSDSAVPLECFLSYNDAQYVIAVKNNSDETELDIGSGYEFALYRKDKNGKILIPSTSVTDFKVYQRMGSGVQGVQIENINGLFEIRNKGTVNVSINHWGIDAQASYDVSVPAILCNYIIESEGVYFKATGEDINSNIGYVFSNVKLALYANNTCVYSPSFKNMSVSVNLNNYIGYRNLTMKVNYIFTKGDKNITIVEEASYSIPYYLINNTFSLGQNKIAIIDASTITNTNLNKTIRIPQDMLIVYLKGNSNREINNLDILVDTRDSALTVYMDNFKYHFMTKGLNVTEPYSLSLNITGNCFIKPKDANTEGGIALDARSISISGSGKLEVMSGKSGQVSHNAIFTQGHPGINTWSLSIKVRDLYVKGGTAGDMEAATGIRHSGVLDGAHGYYGAEGGYAIFATSVYVSSSCKRIVLEGGNGGRGGDAADGLDATDSGVAGGNGGQGGDGGPSGFYYKLTGSSSTITVPSGTELQCKYGIRGNGGNGGNGGKGGDGANGGNGGNGGDGYNGGRGGNGGNGGKGNDGRNAVMFGQSGSNGGNGGNGGIGGNGGDSISDGAGQVGSYGYGGAGGQGGKAGKGIFQSYSNGKNGQNGANGQMGQKQQDPLLR